MTFKKIITLGAIFSIQCIALLASYQQDPATGSTGGVWDRKGLQKSPVNNFSKPYPPQNNLPVSYPNYQKPYPQPSYPNQYPKYSQQYPLYNPSVDSNNAKMFQNDTNTTMPLNPKQVQKAIKNNDIESLKEAYNQNPENLFEPFPDITTTLEDIYPIHKAAMTAKDPLILDLLFEKGANVNKQSESGKTPLFYAIQFNENPEIAHYLIKKGANLTKKDTHGNNLFHALTMSSLPYEDQKIIARQLLNAGLNPQISNIEGTSPIESSETLRNILNDLKNIDDFQDEEQRLLTYERKQMLEAKNQELRSLLETDAGKDLLTKLDLTFEQDLNTVPDVLEALTKAYGKKALLILNPYRTKPFTEKEYLEALNNEHKKSSLAIFKQQWENLKKFLDENMNNK